MILPILIPIIKKQEPQPQLQNPKPIENENYKKLKEIQGMMKARYE